MDIEGIGPDEARRLLGAAAAGDAELAEELERLGLVERDQARTGAHLIRAVMSAMQEAMQATPNAGPGADDLRRMLHESGAFADLVERRGLSPEAARQVAAQVCATVYFTPVFAGGKMSPEHMPSVERVAETYADACRTVGAGDLDPEYATVLADEALHNARVTVQTWMLDQRAEAELDE